MIWLFSSIAASTGLFLIFKWVSHKNLPVLPVIVVNYFTCFLTGNLLPGKPHVFRSELFQSDWIIPVLSMGFLFIAGFLTMGMATHKNGAAPASVASKMSVVIPAVLAIVFFGEQLILWQIIGILVSLVAVFLMVEPQEEGKRMHGGFWLLIAVFFTSGAVDAGLNTIEHYYGKETDVFTTSTLIFGVAGILGSLLYYFKFRHTQPVPPAARVQVISAGIVLGLVNYFSLIAMLESIETYAGKTAWFFAVNNIGVVTLSSILAALLFKEKHHRSAYIGLVLALLALVFMNTDAIF